MPRLFTAIETPRDAALSLSLLRGGLPSAHWIETENYHLTLRFFGDIDGRTADELVTNLDDIRQNRFSVQLSGLGAFGSKKPHALYAAAAASPELKQLNTSIASICRRLAIAPDPRKFTPHVTLARLRGATDPAIAAWLEGHGNFAAAPFTARRFVLMSSKASVGGGPYVIEEAFDLAPAPPTQSGAGHPHALADNPHDQGS
jgi:2'-5' RNA ligase